jgi:hypothetical protein
MSFFRSLLPLAGAAAGGFFGGPAGALIGGGLGSSFGGGRRNNPNPVNGAMDYVQQNPAMFKQYLEPWINRANTSANNLPGLYDRSESLYGNTPPELEEMANNPSAFLDKIFKGYNPSEGYKFKENRLLKEMGNTAAAYGLAGTEEDQLNRGQQVNGLLSQDMQEYLNNVLGIQETGQAGRERYLGGRDRALTNRIIGENQSLDRGANAASNLSGFVGSNNTNAATLSYGGQRENNADRNASRNRLLNMLAMGAKYAGSNWGGFGG